MWDYKWWIAIILVLEFLVFFYNFYNTSSPICTDEFSPANTNHSGQLNLPSYLPHAYCGKDWLENYRILHNNIIKGSAPPRYVVSVALEAGIADRLLGTASEFYYAVFTGRAIKIVTYGDNPSFEAAFDSSFVNWYDPGYPDELVEHVKYTYKNTWNFHGDRSYPASVDPNKYYPFYLTNENAFTDEVFINSNISEWPQGKTHVETIFMSANRGRTVRMFDNKYHAKQLFDMELRPEVAFACAFKFLFTPKPAVFDKFGPIFDILRDPAPLKIGIMIRIYDKQFKDVYNMSQADQYFQCAEEIEAAQKIPGQKVIWHLISASLSLRQQAKAKYGEKLLTNTEAEVGHTDPIFIKSAQNESLIFAIGDLLTWAWNDFHIYTLNSGFGQMGAFLSSKVHNKYTIADGMYNQQKKIRTCGKFDYDSEETLANYWSGI